MAAAVGMTAGVLQYLWGRLLLRRCRTADRAPSTTAISRSLHHRAAQRAALAHDRHRGATSHCWRWRCSDRTTGVTADRATRCSKQSTRSVLVR